MSVANPNLPLLESVVAALGSLCPRFVFIGGCVTGLLITEAGAPPVRTTRDVDVIVEVVSLGEYHTVERQLEQARLRHDRSQDAPVCRWLAGSALLDVMPTDKAVLGFGNRWYEEAVLRTYISHGDLSLLSTPQILDALPGHLPGDSASQSRVPIVIDLLEALTRPRMDRPGPT